MNSIYVRLISLCLLATLACSNNPIALVAEATPTLRPTRTPMPTFTPTPEIEPTSVIPPTATDTPTVEPPTNTPEPIQTDTPVPTDTPEPTTEPPTDTPEPTPTNPPPPPAQEEAPPPPPPTEPPPPAGPVASARGVIGTLTFRDGRNTYSVGEQVFVNIEAKNTSSNPLSFGILGLNTSEGLFQTSWDNSSIAAGQSFTHIDGVPFGTPGNHKIWLSVCYSDKTTCQGPDGEWERYEPGIDVVIQ